MTRYASLALAALSLFSSIAIAADAPPIPPARYAATAEATRSGDTVLISIKVTKTQKAAVPGLGQTDVTTTQASPKLKLPDGQRAQIVIGDVLVTPQGGKSHSDPRDLESGYMIDVISVKGCDQLFMVTVVVEHGQTIWADATTVKITPKPADKQQ